MNKGANMLNFFNSLLLAAAEGENSGATTGAKNEKGWIMYVIIGVVLVLMIVLTIVPQKKRQKEQQNMMNSLCVGTKLMTVGGIVGKITQVNSDNTLIVNVGTETNPTLIVIDKKAVGYVLEKVAAPEAPATDSAPATEDAPAQDAQADNACDNNCDACADKADCDKAVSGEVVEETQDVPQDETK